MAGADEQSEPDRGRTGPTWLGESCPSWCAREHGEDDHPEDRFHQSEPSLFPAVAGSGDTVPLAASMQAVTLGVRIGRQVGEDRTWLLIESLEHRRPRTVLTHETARALLHHLADQLSLTDAEVP
ncbi:hypothetical protein ASE01_10485 [Nocardioides sp. Root190]|uniref:DUF6907 domain-containing protein n=1 Tax=Nocardioides sp. Root190 TaxID=1736488 RepID=UPI0006F994B2|nr:hypothetical protein [Nocardioides sp. Root190]KRB77165.1 hypothetical protein ASE01_10485 [Nocardioides sp. Root190]